MPDYRWQTCPYCNGDGGFDEVTGYDIHGDPTGSQFICTACKGEGDIFVDTEMHAEDWLEKWEQEESA